MVFLFKLKTNLVKMIMVNNFLANRNLMFSLKPQNKNRGEMRMVDNFLMIGQCIYYNVSCRFLQVGHRNPLQGHDLIIDYGHVFWKLHKLLRNCLFPFHLCNKLLFACLNIQTPKTCNFSWKLNSWLSLSASSNAGVQFQRHSMY
jgi:hypothetical protein